MSRHGLGGCRTDPNPPPARVAERPYGVHSLLSSHLLHEIPHSDQVERCGCKHEHPLDQRNSSVSGLPHSTYGLHPAEDLFDQLPLSLARAIARVPGRPSVDRAAHLLRHVRRRSDLAHLLHEPVDVVCLVGSAGDRRAARYGLKHPMRRVPLRGPRRVADAGVHDEPVAILHQSVCHVAELRSDCATLPIHPGVGIGRGSMRVVLSLLSPEVDLGIAPATRRLDVPVILGPEALLARPRLDQRPIDREVLVGKKMSLPRLVQHLREERCRDLPPEKSIPVLAEYRGYPHGIVHLEPNEPPKQQVVVELLHEHPLRADRIENLNQESAQEFLGCDGGPADRGVQAIELRRHLPKDPIHHLPDGPKRMVSRNPLFERYVAPHSTLDLLVTTHCGSPPGMRLKENRGLPPFYHVGHESQGFFSTLLEHTAEDVLCDPNEFGCTCPLRCEELLGWDQYTGYGRVDAGRALTLPVGVLGSLDQHAFAHGQTVHLAWEALDINPANGSLDPNDPHAHFELHCLIPGMGFHWEVIDTLIAADVRSYDWTVPNDFPTGGNRRIRLTVADSGANTNYDYGERFAVVASLADVDNRADSDDFRIEHLSSNPASSDTRIRCHIPRPGDLRVEVFDVGGRRVTTLTAGLRKAGVYALEWDGRDDVGHRVPKGLYFLRVMYGSQVTSVRITVLM